MGRVVSISFLPSIWSYFQLQQLWSWVLPWRKSTGNFHKHKQRGIRRLDANVEPYRFEIRERDLVRSSRPSLGFERPRPSSDLSTMPSEGVTCEVLWRWAGMTTEKIWHWTKQKARKSSTTPAVVLLSHASSSETRTSSSSILRRSSPTRACTLVNSSTPERTPPLPLATSYPCPPSPRVPSSRMLRSRLVTGELWAGLRATMWQSSDTTLMRARLVSSSRLVPRRLSPAQLVAWLASSLVVVGQTSLC